MKNTHKPFSLLILLAVFTKCAAISSPPGPHAVSRVAYSALRPHTASLMFAEGIGLCYYVF